MPSSMIFIGLVVLWLIVLVPAVARHRQEVARPSVAALSSRVIARPERRRSVEVEDMQVDRDAVDVMNTGTEEPAIPAARSGHPDQARSRGEHGGAARAGDHQDDRGWERPPHRYRPGRGGFDAEAAALTARARYTFRQRVVLVLLVLAVLTAGVAAVAMPVAWWVHAAVDVVLVTYLCYLRRQVRVEEQIRARRAARLAGPRRPADDGWDGPEHDAVPDAGSETDDDGYDDGSDGVEGPDVEPQVAERVAGTGEPVGPLRPLWMGADEPALPRLQPAPPPPLPAGTALVEADDEDIALAEVELPHRRAAGE